MEKQIGSYYQFKVDQTPPNEMNTPMLQTGEENDEQPTSLRGRKGVDYTPMLTSDLDSEVETDRKKPKNYRPRASGPSTLRQRAKNVPDCPKQITPRPQFIRIP